MKRIKLILTGGTIGSRIDENGNISPTGEPILLSACKSIIGNCASFEVLEPFSVLSENMTMNERECLIREILALEKCDIDGVIVAHGSDTICFTAALASMALRHLPFPVIFIASDKVLSDPTSNGRDNFESALTLIEDRAFRRGTFISYKDKSGENSVYLGSRLCSAEPLFDAFTPFDGKPLGKTENGRFVYNVAPLNPSIKEINAERKPIIGEDFSLKDNVLMVHSSPALDVERLDISGLCAVINYGYHCGTGNEKGLISLAQRCKKENIPLYLASFKDKTSPVYESLAKVLKMENVIRLYNISPESAFAKVTLAHSLGTSLLEEKLFFEEIY